MLLPIISQSTGLKTNEKEIRITKIIAQKMWFIRRNHLDIYIL